MKRKGVISLADVARQANLSVSTVSLVLNSRGRPIPLRSESIRRVRDSARELGYKPNVFARGLKTGRARLKAIAIIIPHDQALFGRAPSQALAGVTRVATLNGYSCTVLTPGGPLASLMEHPLFVERTAEGVIALAWEAVHYQKLRDSHIYDELPLVALHSESPDEVIPCVNSDDFGNAYKLVEHLYQLGHRRFAFVGGPDIGDATRLRLAGYKRYLAEHDLEFDESNVLYGDYTGVDKQLFLQRMQRDQRPTAIVAISDLVAAKLMGWLGEIGLRVPHDVAIAGFDDDPMSAYLATPLTAIRSTALHQGELAGQMMLDLIHGQPLQRRRVLLPGELLIRESTVPPKQV